MGENNIIRAPRAIAIGENNEVLVGSDDSFAVGSEIIADADSVVALGRGARGLGDRSITLLSLIHISEPTRPY